MKLADLNLDAIRKEFSKIRDMKTFKAEMARLGHELLKLQDHLGPNAKKNLAAVEKRYNKALKTIHQKQKQVNSELDKARKVLDQTRNEVEKRVVRAKKMALAQRRQLAKMVSSQLKAKPKATTKRKASSTGTTRKKRSTTKTSAHA